MSTIIEREKLDTDPVQLMREELAAAQRDRRPISRFGLAAKVVEQTGMPQDQAVLLVEAFCDEHAECTPAYLNNEFGLFWPKVLAAVFTVAGIAVFWFGTRVMHDKRSGWPWLVAGTIVVGIGVFQWVRSLERFQIYSRQKRAERTARLREKYAKPWG